MADELTVVWPGGTKAFKPGVEVQLGRGSQCDVVLDNPNVSRVHALVRHDGGAWVLRDVGSMQGVFKDGRAIDELRLGAIQQVVIGTPQLGVPVEFRAGNGNEASTSPRPTSEPTDGADTVVPERGRPGGDLRSDVFDGATVVAGDTLRVECGGKTYQFSPGRSLVVGRDGAADVPCTNPTVSRNHAVISHDAEGWLLEDAGSRGGTYVDGRRTKSVRLAGSTALWLGDPEAGERLVAVSGGVRSEAPMEKVRRLGRSGVLGIAAVMVALLAVGITFLARSGGGGGEPDLDRLAQAVVRLETDSGAMGSGTIVDAERGLILTNAHVVAPRAPGQAVALDLSEAELDPDPETITVLVSEGIDEVAEPRYEAEVIAVDGYLDLAVLEITGTLGGSLIEQEDLAGLVAVPMGSSDDLQSGDSIRILGHPAVAQSNAATLTAGVVAGPVQDSRVESNSAYLNLDATIRPGNSGGLVADDEGRIVGVPTLNWQRGTDQNVAAMRPIAFAEPLLDAVRAGEEYVSDYAMPLDGDEEITAAQVGLGSDLGFNAECAASLGESLPGDTVVSVQADYSGFAAGQHQDLAVAIADPTGTRIIGWATTAGEWPFEFDSSGCFEVGVQLAEALAPGTYWIEFYLGPSYELEATFTFDVVD